MWDGGYILNHADFQTSSLQGADRGFTTGTRSLDQTFYLTHPMLHSVLGCHLSRHLRGVRSALSRALEALRSGRRPGDSITELIGDGNNGIIKSRLDMSYAQFHVLFFFSSTSLSASQSDDLPSYFFLLAPTVRLGPLRVRALVLVF